MTNSTVWETQLVDLFNKSGKSLREFGDLYSIPKSTLWDRVNKQKNTVTKTVNNKSMKSVLVKEDVFGPIYAKINKIYKLLDSIIHDLGHLESKLND